MFKTLLTQFLKFNTRYFVFLVCWLVALAQVCAFAAYLPGDNDWFDNNYNQKLSYFCAELSAKSYEFEEAKEFLTEAGFSDIVEINTGDGRFLDVQAIVARRMIENKSVQVVVFRGTQEVADWLTDASVKAKPFTFNSAVSVHAGFDNSLVLFINKLNDPRYSAFPAGNIRIILTGHSLGGAIATLYAAALKKNNITDVVTYTFGAPAVGKDSFVQKYGDLCLYRIRNEYDPIPYLTYLPALISNWDYKHTGQMKVFNKQGVDITSIYENKDFLDIGKLLFNMSEHSSLKYAGVIKRNLILSDLYDKGLSCQSSFNKASKEKEAFECSQDLSSYLFLPRLLDVYYNTVGSTVTALLTDALVKKMILRM